MSLKRSLIPFIEWSENNWKKAKLPKTWELLLGAMPTRTPPGPLEIIGMKEKLKLLSPANP